MMKGRKKGYMAAVICLLMLCVGILAGCSNTKYTKIELPETAAADFDLGDTDGKARTRTDDNGAEAALSQSVEGNSVPLESSPYGQISDKDQAATSLFNKEITTSNGFTDVDETVYVNSDMVNVRKECAPAAEVVTQLNTGDAVRRTGYSDSWSRIQYGEQVCYISTEFVSAGKESDGEQSQETLPVESDEVQISGTENAPVTAGNGKIVAIDPGHQAKGNSEKEPIGPGSETLKAKVASGATGVSTGVKEYELTLAVSKKLKKILEDRGYQVYMIRETHDVNISNSERADMANNSGASVFVRIHGNSLDNGSVHGALAMCQTSGNPYNGGLHSQSYSLSKKIVDGICQVTGAKNRGVQETDTMSGINWCNIPVSIVEMGFMSNTDEDKNMADDAYQDRLAQGIANGIDAYFSEN